MHTSYPYFLGGKAVSANTQLEVRNKYSGEVATRVAQADGAALETAIAAAAGAAGAMRALPAHRRRAILEHLREGVAARREEFAHVLAVEVGKPIRDARAEVTRCLHTLELSAEEATRIGGDFVPLDVAEHGEGLEAVWRRVPLGPVGLISPFNFPLNLSAHKVGPAIAAGCPFVLKPASATPVSALLLGEILAETDLPPGAFSVLPLDREDADLLVTDDRLRLLSFTGSAQVGWDLKARAGRKRVVLELGGNAAAIVDASADVADAAKRVAKGAFYVCGQSCIRVQRVFVHASCRDAFVEQLVRATEALVLGDPLREETDVGPLISEKDARRVEAWTREAVDAGARVLTGGERDGAFCRPTLLEDVPRDAKVNAEEVFGPVTTISTFESLDDAIDDVNAGRYGLQAGIFTRDLDHALRAWDRVECGGVVVNDTPSLRIDSMPYGGVKDSGFGREGPRFAVQDMTEMRLLVIRRARD